MANLVVYLEQSYANKMACAAINFGFLVAGELDRETCSFLSRSYSRSDKKRAILKDPLCPEVWGILNAYDVPLRSAVCMFYINIYDDFVNGKASKAQIRNRFQASSNAQESSLFVADFSQAKSSSQKTDADSLKCKQPTAVPVTPNSPNIEKPIDTETAEAKMPGRTVIPNTNSDNNSSDDSDAANSDEFALVSTLGEKPLADDDGFSDDISDMFADIPVV